ncbi:LemA family protein [Candidatus Roizmanbacteria bacterium]|nr:MAG: LemA family protein [Candidatus Roizmanbacteria bacterium]
MLQCIYAKGGDIYLNPLLIGGGVLLVVGLYLVATYNSLVVLKTRIQEALSGIDVQLKRRADLIPNLVETVKGYAKHEKEVFENVTKARSALMNAQGMQEKAEANDMLTGALKSLFAVAEAYPDLKANTNFQDLQRQLEDTEDKVAYSRQFYNSNVLDYNAKIQMFPSNIVAGLFGFKSFEFFKAGEADRENVKVSF